jgi:D-alanyl-D-alanine carboxypeptidase/D-alanyl-D-alanine-endopeptidase (penicillin-binding protein 4)
MSSRSSAAIVTLAFASWLSAAQPAPPSSLIRLQHEIDAILNAPALSHGFFGVLVKSIKRDETFYSLNAGKLMMPASTMKIVTLAAAAEKLGWDYRSNRRR